MDNKNFSTEGVIQLAKDTIRIEIDTLQAVEKSLDHNFYNCLDRILNSSGRVVVTGIGKSALIGQKIVATFNSTGTPSIFMHAVDAIHGDLGIVQGGDVVLILSKSGNSPEIRALIPLIRNLGNQIIGLVSNRSSYLAKQAEGVIFIPVEKEADPNGLAPTASAVAQMAVGDALAVCLLSLKGFDIKAFASLHPGGALGKQLYLRVRDLYVLHEPAVVGVDASISDVIMEISSKRLGATAVLDEEKTLCGIITDGDLRRMIGENDNFKFLKAGDIMTKDPKIIDPDELAARALLMMRKNSITQLLVVQGKVYLGILHIHDLLKEGIV